MRGVDNEQLKNEPIGGSPAFNKRTGVAYTQFLRRGGPPIKVFFLTNNARMDIANGRTPVGFVG
jgi:hypothetical protein